MNTATDRPLPQSAQFYTDAQGNRRRRMLEYRDGVWVELSDVLMPETPAVADAGRVKPHGVG